MARKGRSTEEIISALREAEVRIGQPDPAGRRVSVLDEIRVNLSASGVNEDTALGAAAGSSPRIALLGSHDGSRLDIRALDIETPGASARLNGVFEAGRFEGTAHIQLSDLSRFADIASRPLSGQATFDAKIDGNLAARTFVLSMQAGSSGVGLGVNAIDGILKPATRYSARIERASDGTLSARDILISNDLLTATLQGSRPTGSLVLSGNIRLSSLAAVHPDLSGEAQLDVKVDGPDSDIRSSIMLSGEGVSFNGKPFEKPALSFVGGGPLTRHQGKFVLSGTISDETLAGRASIVLTDAGAIAIDGIVLEIAGAKLSGAINIGDAVRPSGRLNIDARDLARLGRALGVDLRGRLQADVALSAADGRSVATLNVAADNVAVGDLRVANVRSTGEIANVLDAPTGVASMHISGIAQGAKAIGNLSLWTNDSASLRSLPINNRALT